MNKSDDFEQYENGDDVMSMSPDAEKRRDKNVGDDMDMTPNDLSGFSSENNQPDDDHSAAPPPSKFSTPASEKSATGLSLDIENDTAPEEQILEDGKSSAPQKSDNGKEMTTERGKEEMRPENMRLGDRLIKEGHITRDQLEVALYEKSKTGGMLGETLVDLGFLSADTLASVLSESSGYEEFNPKDAIIDPDALKLISKSVAQRFTVLPVVVKNGSVHIAMADPYDVMALDRLRQIVPKEYNIEPMICAPSVLIQAIDRAYGFASSTKDIMAELAGKEIDLEGIEEMTGDAAYSHPIVRLVNALVIDAVKMGASDLHFEPEENFVRLRYRIDGILITVQTIHKEYWQAIAQRLKIMSGMNIADKIMPQDGRFYLNVGSSEADFRVSSLPTVHGENFVLRVLDKQAGIMPLESLGFSDHNMRLIRKSQARPEGIIIVTGPTGSGKTTSLYSMLNAINKPDVNIMTLEDPVEYSLPMIRQTHVRGGAGLSFADGVKALLRQDPDIIFIGEVRDGVTAEQALKAAMTGHQVYTTLHTNDCFGAIPRLLDLGLQPGMLAGAIIASFAQRLVRRLCDCKEMRTATEEECKLIGMDPANPPEIGHAVGCEKCDGSGYKGRTAVVEILFTNEAINDVIADGAQKTQLKKVAREHGFKSMLDDGIDKLLKGQTSLEALMKSVDFSERM